MKYAVIHVAEPVIRCAWVLIGNSLLLWSKLLLVDNSLEWNRFAPFIA